MIFFFSQCGNENEPQITNKVEIKYRYSDRYLIKEEYQNNRIMFKTVLNKNTVEVKEKTEFFENGNIKKWNFYRKASKYPMFISYFDSIGNYSQIKGTPFVSSGTTKDGEVVVELVNPPKLKLVLTYREFNKGILQHQISYEPFKTDTTSWVTLDEYKPVAGNKYFVCCKFYSNGVFVDSISNELLP